MLFNTKGFYCGSERNPHQGPLFQAKPYPTGDVWWRLYIPLEYYSPYFSVEVHGEFGLISSARPWHRHLGE